MNGQQRMTVCLAGIIGMTIFMTVVGSMRAFNERMRIMAENGLCEQVPQTMSSGPTVWGRK
jgi:hypothetical protein